MRQRRHRSTRVDYQVGPTNKRDGRSSRSVNMSKTEDRSDEILWRSWTAGYTAGGKNWRTSSEMKCPRRYDKTAYKRGWIKGKSERAAITAKQEKQYRWRAAGFSSGTQAEQTAAKKKADQLEVEIKAMLVAMRERRGGRLPIAD
jgi:hypothetical protein